MNRIIVIISVFILALPSLSAQELIDDSTSVTEFNILRQILQGGDTLLHTTIREVSVFPEPQFDRRRDMRRYERLVYNLKIVHPYAVLAAGMLDEMNNAFVELKTERERNQFIKQVERELMDEFEDELKSLTITQGRLLIKLIDRETGNTSYELLRELRGSFSAFFWQAVARLFGSNLKTTFDAEGEDKLIDQIIVMIENGQI
jgi:hypothetical protein